MITGNEPATALPAHQLFNGATVTWTDGTPGLTIRQHVAAMAQSALLSDIETLRWIKTDARFNGLNFKEVVAINAVEFTDALINELNKQQ